MHASGSQQGQASLALKSNVRSGRVNSGPCTVDLADGHAREMEHLTEFEPSKNDPMEKICVGHQMITNDHQITGFSAYKLQSF